MGTHTNGREPATRSVLDSLRRLFQSLRAASAESERTVGVNAAQLFVLGALREEGPASVNELARRTFTHQSTVSGVVSGLEERGYVSRTRRVEDRRESRIELTARGRSLVRRGPSPAHRSLIRRLESPPNARVH